MHVAPGGDPAIARLAARQHGVVTYAQLTSAGLGRGAIGHRLARGRLHRLHRGVFLVGHALPPPLALETAAILACGPGAALSHYSAAAMWGLLQPGEGVHVSVLRRNPAPRAGVRIHRVRHLERHDIARRHGLPVTAPPRTLLDLADVLSVQQLERVVAEALTVRLVKPRQLDAFLARSAGRGGVRSLRAALDEGPTLTRSEAETRLLALVRAARLPPPAGNVRLAAHEVDFLWREERLVVEVDGYAYHSTRRAFEQDRRRDAELRAGGFDVMRVTRRQIVDEPEALVARLAQRLSSGKWQ